MRLIATRQGLLRAPAPAPAARRGWLKGLGAALGAALLARPAQASPTQITGYQPYIGEIMLVGFTFTPNGWLNCDGSLLPISQYDTLYSLLGTTYGGDGQQTFGLPDLRGRAPIHRGQGPGLSNHQLGQTGGQESVTLATNSLPTHNHGINNSGAAATSSTPTGLVPAVPAGTDANGEAVAVLAYTGSPNTNEAASATTGSNAPIDLRSSLLVMRYCISTQGIYPSQP